MGDPVFHEERVRLTSTILAIRHAYQLIDDRCATCPRHAPREGQPSLYYAV
jgi:hypothetical protein